MKITHKNSHAKEFLNTQTMFTYTYEFEEFLLDSM